MRAFLPPLAVAGLALAAPAHAQTQQASPARMSTIVRTLASPPFQGRSPGTEGEDTTIAYLVDQMEAIGLQPAGPDGQWTQKVPMIRTQIDADGAMSINGKQSIALKQGDNINVTTVRPDKLVSIKDAPIVFVGYGVDAPEADWDDFKDVDVAGKVVVFLINDPDFKAEQGEDAKGRFGDRRMTYYGRWTYKFEEAARRGAAAALIIHDTDAAGYGWETVSASNGENYDIMRGPDAKVIPLQGWIRGDLADKLFAAAGLDLAKLRVEARSAGFRPVELKGLHFNAALPVEVKHIESRNVIGKIAGKTHPDEAVMIGAHWDAYGVGKPDAQGRTIRPGANDDGLGIAGVLELARMFKASPAPERTLLFAAWTGEERGLLGSEYYAEHPYVPLSKTVADLTMDILQTAGPAKNVVLVGKGNSTLDQDLAQAAESQDRTVVPETFSERGLFFRADHFSVARRGVPSLLLMALGGPPELKQGGTSAGQRWLDDYMKCYHQTCDTWSKDWDLRGAAQDVDLFYDVGEKLATSRQWPTWRPGFAFAKIRAETDDQRK